MSKQEKKKTEKAEKVATPDTFCLCGCGIKLVGKKSKFTTGHDMKVKSAIIKNIKAGKPMFDGIAAGAAAYAKVKWVDGLTKSIKTNAGKSAVKGQKFETAEAKEKVFNAAISNYEKQLAA